MTARCLGGHIDMSALVQNILERLHWKPIRQDVKKFVLACDRCQKVNPVQHAEVAELHPVPVPTAVMAQIGVDITNLPRTKYGYCFVVVAMDYFSKWQEARALKDYTAKSVAKFIFEDIICRHGSSD